MATINAIGSANPIQASFGGTGDSTITSHAVLIGEGTGNIASVGPGTTGQVLQGNTGADPSFTGSPSFSGSVTTGTTITATLGNITATSGNLVLTAATTSTVGQITQAGNPILHTYDVAGGGQSIFVGTGAGNFTNTDGNHVAIGYQALSSGSATQASVAIGHQALKAATTASFNVAVGPAALTAITTGTLNTAVGYASLSGALTSGGKNTCLGYNTGSNYTTTDSSNICIGYGAAGTTGTSNNLIIGNGTGTGTGNINKTVVCGIQGITVTGTAILVSATDQLGIAVSSARFKENIHDLESTRILELKPKSFNYKVGEDHSPQTGLIAEEVYEIMPELVVLDKEGLPQTVKYHELGVLLLFEMQKLKKRIEELENK